MSQKNFDMLVDKLNELMNQKGLNQAALVKSTDISQPQMSKIINGQARPTLDQIISLADTLDVSIDYLLGRNNNTSSTKVPSNVDIFNVLAPLFENNIIATTSIDYCEDAYVDNDSMEEFAYPYMHIKKDSKYTAYFFPNYYKVLSIEEYQELDPDERDDYQNDLYIAGNECNRNKELNDFMKYYSKLIDLKNNAGMDNDIYSTALQDRIDKLKY